MSKYNLSELLNELSNAEMAKIKLMQKLKNKEISDEEFAKVGDDDDSAIAALTADLVKKEKDLENNMEEETNEVGGMLNITDPSNPKLTSFEAMITNTLAKAYPSAESNDLKAFYNQLMDNVKAKRVDLEGLDLGEEFEQFADDNNILLKDPPANENSLKEHFARFK